jgi:hypothetical protein
MSNTAGNQQVGSPFRLIVREYVPQFIAQNGPLHTSIVERLDQVLAVPWIARLPGEKRLVYSHGKRVVIQEYSGCHLVRAHVQWDYKVNH